MKNMKLQSAMEYLMTYGWAILIIAVVMVALFALGVFNGQSSTACVASSGYLCQAPIYSHTTGNVVVTVGQTTGTNWATANVYFIAQGTPSPGGVPNPMTSLTAATCAQGGQPGANSIGCVIGAASPGLVNGQTATVSIPVSGGSAATTPTTAGQSAAGALWVAYTTSTAPGTAYYVQIATVTLKAV
ncbi:MAG: hypothetical protein KGH64_03335 [Candidatus Micrarchaeota archaeon]|nr:hypothetical protein [Candidatus Micrarchaeota archaeon]MDE1834346.1 hypothetical protein [Candidatus Micrarchaeota archaeon]MDE1860032.1 hypothetical protein [Candidatus Micrarchaeota archaeon]